MSKLAKQCAELNLSIEKFQCTRALSTKLWIGNDYLPCRPELIALSTYKDRGYEGTWCEGGTLKLLMKAASFQVLVENNLFSCRTDACRRCFEAQCVLLPSMHGHILAATRNATQSEIEHNSTEILNDTIVQDFYPRVSVPDILRLWIALGRDRLASIACIFISNPYDYGAGWPDLTLTRKGDIRFIEVKTTDSLHESQIRITKAFAGPLRLNFSVAQVVPKK